MEINRKRASSHKVSQTSWTGTVFSRDQLRQQLSEKKKASTSTVIDSSPHTVSGPVGETYAVPHKTADGVADHGNSSKPRMGPITSALDQDGGDLDADITLFEDEEGKVKGVVELSTLRQKRSPHIKLRVICLIDVSGSMLLKGDKRRQRSKISILKSMAADVIDALEEEEDFFGVMTFGEAPRVVCPLQKVSAESRCEVKEKVSSLDRDWGFSAVTDLSSALLLAVALLSSAQLHQSLVYRNCIIVFSDGEVNAGETDPQKLVHATREKIREVGTPQGVLGDLWVNVSCVTTGSHFSQSLYLLSKMCGSDAYFFVDGSRDHPEADMLVPLLLRKRACAQLVSVTVSAAHGARLLSDECSQEYSVRRKRGGARRPHGEGEAGDAAMTYFLHDMPQGARKTFTIALQVDDEEGRAGVQGKAGRVSCSSEDGDASPLLTLHVQYVDADGVLHDISKQLQRQDVLSLLSPQKSECVRVVAKHAVSSLRQLFQNTCREVALILENKDNYDDNPETLAEEVIAAVKAGKEKFLATAAMVLPHLDDPETLCEFQAVLSALQANLHKLQSTVTTHLKSGSSGGRGAGWQLSKALASAVARQLPTTSRLLLKPQVVCPLLLQGRKEAEGSGGGGGPRASVRMQALNLYVLGASGEEEGGLAGGSGNSRSKLLLAVGAVATSLADVLKMVEKGDDLPL